MPTSTPTTRSTHARRTVAGAATGLVAAALVLVAPVAASAHVHVTPGSTEAGATTELAFSYSHGCDGSPTRRVEVTMPDEIASIALIANPGWQVASELVDGARTVVFTTDAPTPDAVRETLEVEVTLPDDAPEGTVLAFPALQVCETGETLWGDDDPESDSPAPTITIGAEAGAHDHGGHDHGAAGEGEAAHDHGDADAAAQEAGGEPASAEAAAPADDAGASPAVPVSIAALVVAALAAVLGAVSLRRQAQGR